MIIRFNPIAIILILALAIFTDGIDGFLAISEESKGRISFSIYLRSLTGDRKAKELVSKSKANIARIAPYGPRMDVAGDRVMELCLWIAFVYVHLIPLILLLTIIIRHAVADSLMGLRGTSSKMNSRIGAMIYKSNTSRAGINVMKFVTFAYLALQYVWGYPAIIGYALVAILFVYIMARGFAEIYDTALSLPRTA